MGYFVSKQWRNIKQAFGQRNFYKAIEPEDASQARAIQRPMTLEYYADLIDRAKINWTDKCETQGKSQVSRQYDESVEKQRYDVVHKALNLEVFFIMAVHLLEGSGNWNTQLHNGELWSKKTTLVPKGLGPWADWVTSCIHPQTGSLIHRGQFITNGYFEEYCKESEAHNGWGYRSHGKDSAYLVGGTSIKTGKYVADGVFDQNAVSSQIGFIPLALMGEKLGYWTLKRYSTTTVPVPIPLPVPTPNKPPVWVYGTTSPSGKRLQNALNTELLIHHPDLPQLAVDSNLGGKSNVAFKLVSGKNLLNFPENP